MPNLIDNETVDRFPGQGKTLLIGGIRTPVGGLAGLGQPSGGGSSTPPAGYATLMPAGSVLPPPGSSARAQFFVAFKAAVGFDGKSVLGPFPTHADSPSWAMSMWLNYGITNVVGFHPTPLVNGPIVGLDGSVFDTIWSSNTGAAGTTGFLFNVKTGSPQPAAPFMSFSWPSTDIGIGGGWQHLMVSAKLFTGTAGDIFCNLMVYLGDTPIYNSSFDTGALVTSFSFSSVLSYIGDSVSPSSGTGLYAAVTEFWEAPGHFVDWSNPNNRNRFHTSDGFNTYAPVNLGSTGALALGFKPRTYLSGPPSLFVNNRANGGAALTLNGDALVLIDDVPS